MAPVRAYLPELLADTLSGAIDPGRVFDLELPLEKVAEAYAAMDERRVDQDAAATLTGPVAQPVELPVERRQHGAGDGVRLVAPHGGASPSAPARRCAAPSRSAP